MRHAAPRPRRLRPRHRRVMSGEPLDPHPHCRHAGRGGSPPDRGGHGRPPPPTSIRRAELATLADRSRAADEEALAEPRCSEPLGQGSRAQSRPLRRRRGAPARHRLGQQGRLRPGLQPRVAGQGTKHGRAHLPRVRDEVRPGRAGHLRSHPQAAPHDQLPRDRADGIHGDLHLRRQRRDRLPQHPGQHRDRQSRPVARAARPVTVGRVRSPVDRGCESTVELRLDGYAESWSLSEPKSRPGGAATSG